LSAIVGSEGACRGDGDEEPRLVLRVDEDRMEAQAARAGHPRGAGAVLAKTGELGPVLAAVGGLEDRRVLDAGVDRVGVAQRRLEVPHALELPRMRRAVVPLVRARHAVIQKLVADGLPGLPAVVAPLHRLAEPVAALRGVDAVGIDRRSFEVIELPAAEEGAVDVPLLALAVRRHHERALARPYQYTDSAHGCLPRSQV